MLSPQKISETLKVSQRFYEPDPSTISIRLWHIMNGSISSAVLSFFFALSGLVSLFHKQDHITLLFTTAFYAMVALSVHVSTSRQGYVRVFESVVGAAQALERQVNPRQLRKMMRFTRGVRILTAVVIGCICFHIFMFWAIPLWRRSLGAPIPSLPDVRIVYWSAYFVESVVATMGPLAALSLIRIVAQVSLCLTCMYRILAESFREVEDREILNELIRIHQSLLAASSVFTQVMSGACFSIVFNTLCMTIGVTFSITALSFDVYLVSIIMTVFGVFCLPCILGQLVATSSAGIGFAAYESGWGNAVPSMRKDLFLVILRSRKTACIKAGLFGTLDLRKITWFVDIWYRMVQALLNLQ